MREVFSKMSVALDSSAAMETQAAQLNLLLYQMYRPYFNGKQHCIAHKILGRRHSYKWAGKVFGATLFLGIFSFASLAPESCQQLFFCPFPRERFLPRPISRKSPLSAIAVEEKKSRRRTLSPGLWEKGGGYIFSEILSWAEKKREEEREMGQISLSLFHFLAGGERGRERERDRPLSRNTGCARFP